MARGAGAHKLGRKLQALLRVQAQTLHTSMHTPQQIQEYNCTNMQEMQSCRSRQRHNPDVVRRCRRASTIPGACCSGLTYASRTCAHALAVQLSSYIRWGKDVARLAYRFGVTPHSGLLFWRPRRRDVWHQRTTRDSDRVSRHTSAKPGVVQTSREASALIQL